MPTSSLPNNLNLRQLSVIRALLLCAQVLARYLAETQLGWMLPYVTLDLLFTALLVFALLAWWRSLRPWPVTDVELFTHFALDVLGFSAVLYFSGGATNPFVSYLLVPLCLAAAALPWAYTWLLGALCLGVYTALLSYHVPLLALAPEHHGQHGSSQAHTLGMWLNFVLSAGLISYFVVKMAHQLRHREQELAAIREQELQHDQLLAVATLAAGTAHELGTPLASIQVISEDLQEELAEGELAQEATALNEQVRHCKNILNKLVATARELSSAQPQRDSGGHFFQQLLENWQLLRPECQLSSAIAPAVNNLELEWDGTVQQSLLNLLNNAADVSPHSITLEANLDKGELLVAISDRGPGPPAGGARAMRKAFVSTKGSGLGLGLFISHTTAERYDGSLSWLARDGGGSRLELRLPLARVCPQLQSEP